MEPDGLLFVLVALNMLEFSMTVNSETTAGYSTADETWGVQTTRVTTLNITGGLDGAGSGVSKPPAEKIPVYLGGFFALPGGGWDGSGVLVAVEMALDHINEDANILTDYELKMVWSDTRCDAGLGTRHFFEQIQEPPQKLMLIGPACSPAAQAVAQTSFYWNLITMSYSAASSALSNRVVFPYFYRTYVPDTMLNRARMRIIRNFGWKRVATINENHDLFSLAINDMINLLKADNITVISSESFDEDPSNQIANLKLLDAHVIISNTYESKARRIFCEAWKQGLTGPGYVWFVVGWWSYRWWTFDDDWAGKCTHEEIVRAVESSFYIATESVVFGKDTVKTVAGITPSEFDHELRRRLSLPRYENYTYNGIATYGYDAAWAIALALNRSAEILRTKRFQDGSIRRLEDFTYDDKEMSQLFFDAVDKTNFYGASGPVSFLGADRISVTQIEQLKVGCWPHWVQYNDACYLFVDLPNTGDKAAKYCSENDASELAAVSSPAHLDFLTQTLRESKFNDTKWLVQMTGSNLSDLCAALGSVDGHWDLVATNCSTPLPFICQDAAEHLEVTVGSYDTANDILVMDSDLFWPGGVVPSDKTPVIVKNRVEVYVGINLETFICFFALAGIGILLSVAFLVFNFKYRSLRIVRMSSPNLNNIILIGASLVYASVIIYGIDRNLVDAKYLLFCCHLRVCLLSIGFVLAFGAMFSKTWRVHKVVAFKTPKRIVVQDRQLLAMVAVLFFIDVAILLPWQLIFSWRTEILFLPEKEQETEILAPFVEFCTGDHFLYWSIALFSFKGLLLIFGAFLAWETRQVTIPALNDSKLIGMSVYNVFILCIVGLAINLVLGQDPATLFIFNSAISIFCTTLTILIVFLPKVFAVCKKSDEDPMQESKLAVSQISTETNIEKVKEYRRMKQTIVELQRQLKESGSVNSTRLATPSRDGRLKLNGYNCGVWCCGIICGCSPNDAISPNSIDENDIDNYVHTNDVDLSLEVTINP